MLMGYAFITTNDLLGDQDPITEGMKLQMESGDYIHMSMKIIPDEGVFLINNSQNGCPACKAVKEY